MLIVGLFLFVTINGVRPLSLLPPNLLIETFDSKIPVYMSLQRILGNTVLSDNVVNITATTLILIVLANIFLGSREK